MRLLLAEDDADLSRWLARLLRGDNHVVDCTADGEETDAALAVQDYDLVLLDLGLPGMDGLTVLRRMRARGVQTPVLILTAQDAIERRVAGLDAGADDYMVKPFDVQELEARIRAALRRGRNNPNPTVACGKLVMDTNARSFSLDGAPLTLTAREHAVLEALLLRANRPVPKQRLAELVFGLDDEANPSAIEIYVHRVRRKLEPSSVGIVTLRGLGYVLRDAAPGGG